MNVDIKVVKLLSSRLCHDLAGLAGAVHNGMELVDEMGVDEGGDALKMVFTSVEQLSARLGFFRMAFGLGGLSGRKPALAESRDIVEAYLQGGRVSLIWPEEEGADLAQTISAPVIRLLLNMVLVAIDALPRGGALDVTLAGLDTEEGKPAIGIAIKATGEGARLRDELRAALSFVDDGDNVSVLNAHNVHGFFCQQLARELSTEVEVLENDDEVQFAVLSITN